MEGTRVRNSRGDVGIWHETYRVEAGAYEAVYSGMPTRGLGRVGRLVPATGRRETARQRLQKGAPEQVQPEQVQPDGDRVPG
jgi:hypothetical protein